jgi:hypothetical protein
MRSRAERAARALALIVLVWTWWRLVFPVPASRGMRVVDQAHLGLSLAAWSTSDGPAAIHVRLAAVPGPTERDWLSAIDRAGGHVTWDAASARLPATAIDAEPVADPRPTSRVSVAVPIGAPVALGDRFGAFDTTVAPYGLASFTLPRTAVVAATVNGTTARASASDSLVLRRLYLVGRAGWEAKFVARALEEEGWAVDAHFTVAPNNNVVPATTPGLDTGEYAAIILVDTVSSPDVSHIAHFVQSGGGLVLGPHAARAIGASGLTTGGTTIAPTVVARRVGEGRVVEVSDTATWQWRMADNDTGMVRHRAWWSGLVSIVAYAPLEVHAGRDPTIDPAPLLALRERLGGPRPAPALATPDRWSMPMRWLFAAATLLLLAEWTSRRLRGAA